jgi:hypothetical protein
MTKSREEKSEFTGRDRLLLFAFALGPLACLTDLVVSYSLVQTACARGSKLMLHISTLAFLLLSLCSALVGWRLLRSVGAELTEREERTRWLSTVTIALALTSAMVILAMGIPNLILRSCD